MIILVFVPFISDSDTPLYSGSSPQAAYFLRHELLCGEQPPWTRPLAHFDLMGAIPDGSGTELSCKASSLPSDVAGTGAQQP